jgi:hypothetical protein
MMFIVNVPWGLSWLGGDQSRAGQRSRLSLHRSRELPADTQRKRGINDRMPESIRLEKG